MSAVVDTNTLIYHLNGQLTPTAKMCVQRALSGQGWVSVITKIEVLGWKGLSREAYQRAERLLEQFREMALSEEIAQRCIALRRANPIRLPDAVIAASALYLNLPLITRNRSDFKEILGLKVINPFDEF